MCGRYSLLDYIKLAHGLPIKDKSYRFTARYNIAPSQEVPVIVNDDGLLIKNMRWGLIPSWAKEESIGYKMINARAETVATKPSFRKAFKNQRCLVPTDGFYEWKQENGKKTPYRILMKDEATFTFAGLWDQWKKPDGSLLQSFTIITTAANETLKALHDRMPVILGSAEALQWLDPNTPGEILSSLLKPYPDDMMKFYEVSKMVNSPKNDREDILKPINV
jgi:putative SOS response-associated peptidase YedK